MDPLKAKDNEFYESLMLHNPVATAFLDGNGSVITVNPAFQRLFGYSLEECMARHIDTLVADDGEMLAEAAAYTRRLLEPGETIRARGVRRTREGTRIEVEMQGVPVTAGNCALGVLVIYADISDRLEAQRNLKYATSSLSIILDSLDADVYVADMETFQVLFMNRHMRDSFGGDFSGQICYQVFRKESRQCTHCSNARLIDAHGGPTGAFVWDGLNPITGRWYRNADRAIPWENGRHVRIQIAVDITDQKAAEARLQELATHDPLTGLPNRVVFDDRLSHAVSCARREKNSTAVMFIDLDGFKAVNDSMGHDCGNELLRSVAGRLRVAVRESDTLARLSGDEFGVLIDRLDNPEIAERVANRALEAISRPHVLSAGEARVTASVGIALYPRHAESAADLMRCADKAMYSSKRTGKNRWSMA